MNCHGLKSRHQPDHRRSRGVNELELEDGVPRGVTELELEDEELEDEDELALEEGLVAKSSVANS